MQPMRAYPAASAKSSALLETSASLAANLNGAKTARIAWRASANALPRRLNTETKVRARTDIIAKSSE
jgi:hypothetical protein